MAGAADAGTAALLDVLDACAAATDLDAFGERLATAILDLVPGTIASYNEIDLRSGGARAAVSPADAPSPELDEAFAAYAGQNPLVQRQLAAPDTAVLRMSDVVDLWQLKATDLYGYLYKPVGIDRQVAFALRPRPHLLVGLAISRSGRDFCDDEVRVLARLRPVLDALWERAALLTALDVGDTGGAQLLISGTTVVYATSAGEAVLRSWFPATDEGCLPEVLVPWLRTAREAAEALDEPPPFVRRRGSRWLELGYHHGRGARDVISVTVRGTDLREATARFGLSRREADVVAQVIAGASDTQAAHALGISPRTVAKHLQHVYAKLDVHSRAELAALFAHSTR